jgi:hypothetical protein
MNNDDGHNCVFVHKKNEREKEKEIDLSHLSLSLFFLGVHTSWFPFSFVYCSAEGKKMNFFFFLLFFYIINLVLFSFAYRPQPH